MAFEDGTDGRVQIMSFFGKKLKLIKKLKFRSKIEDLITEFESSMRNQTVGQKSIIWSGVSFLKIGNLNRKNIKISGNEGSKTEILVRSNNFKIND